MSAVLFVISLAGVPENMATWAGWLDDIPGGLDRWVIGGVGLLLFTVVYGEEITQRVQKWLTWSQSLSRLSDAELKRECERVSQDMLQFMVDREAAQPDLPMGKRNWNLQTNDLIRHSQLSVSLFHQRFGAKMVWLRDELSKREYDVSELDRYANFAVNPFAMREVAQRLGAIAEQLTGR